MLVKVLKRILGTALRLLSLMQPKTPGGGGARSSEGQGCTIQKSRMDPLLGTKPGVRMPISKKKYPF